MKTLLLTLTALFLLAPVTYAVAEETDDVFLDDGGMIDEPPAGEPVALPQSEPDPEPDSAPLTQPDPKIAAEPIAEDPIAEPASAQTPVLKAPPSKKAHKAAKVAKAEKHKADKKSAKKAIAKNASKAGAKSRKVASKEGFRTTRSDCKMYSKASSGSSVLLTVPGSKKLWVEEHGKWLKAFRKNGHGYMSRSCFE